MNYNPKKRVLLAGGSGFLGRALAAELLRRSYEVVVLTRTPRERGDGAKEVKWDGFHFGEWIQFLDGATAVVNLTGRSVNCRHTPRNVREINESRVNSVAALGAAIYQLERPPRVWVQAGSLAIYGDPDDRWCDESAPYGEGELVETCKLWEKAFNGALVLHTRRVLLRIGIVLDREGGALPVLERLTRRFLGGRVGSGRQYISWIHLGDMNRMFLDAIERDDLSGAFNATSPRPVTNKEFMRELRGMLGRPWSPPAPVWVVRLGSWFMRTEPSLALSGRRCAPKRFVEKGFTFRYPDLHMALRNLYGFQIVLGAGPTKA